MSFDPDQFLNSAVTGANDTKVIPVPMGEYQGIIEKVLPRQWQSKDGTQTGIALDVFWLIEDANVKSILGRDTVTCKQGIMLDTAPSGGLDMTKGKNIGLGRLREAVGMNDPSQSFSFHSLPGQSAKVSVQHRIVGEDTFAEVKGVAKL
jgi:hypothetical protein